MLIKLCDVTQLSRHMDRLLDGYTGGALRQLLCRRVAMGSLREAYEQVTAVLATRIKTNTRLQLVYDIIPEGATFDMGLSWVLDSRRSPLQADLSDEAYEENMDCHHGSRSPRESVAFLL